jgi:diguanylate cyclase (GGDEF)-like protein
MSRAAVMVLALVVLNLLMGVLSLVVARRGRTSRALRLWGWGAVIYSLGLLITLATFLPVNLIKVIGNGMIAFAPVPMIAGVLYHTHYRLPLRWIGAAYLATLSLLIFNHLQPHPWVIIDFLGPAPLANALFLCGALALLLDPPRDARTAARFLSASFWFALAVWTARLILLWFNVGGTNDRDKADLTVSLFAIAQMVVAVSATLALLWIEVRGMEAQLERIAYEDPLTKLPNRRAAMMRFDEEVARAARHGQQFALLVLDVDHFKRCNDTYGHQAGDAVLAHVAATMGAQKRGEDMLGRIGGEEFIFLLTGLSGAGAAKALEAADRVRERVAATPATHDGKQLSVTISGGLALFPADGNGWDTLFSTADQRLYVAKHAGRNRVVGPDLLAQSTTAK